MLGRLLAVGSVENGIHSPLIELHFSERLASHAVRQRQFSGQPNIVDRQCCAAGPGGVRASRLKDRQIGAVPIVDSNGTLVGIVSYVDMLRELIPFVASA